MQLYRSELECRFLDLLRVLLSYVDNNLRDEKNAREVRIDKTHTIYIYIRLNRLDSGLSVH